MTAQCVRSMFSFKNIKIHQYHKYFSAYNYGCYIQENLDLTPVQFINLICFSINIHLYNLKIGDVAWMNLRKIYKSHKAPRLDKVKKCRPVQVGPQLLFKMISIPYKTKFASKTKHSSKWNSTFHKIFFVNNCIFLFISLGSY